MCRLTQIQVGTPSSNFDPLEVETPSETREFEYDELGRMTRTIQGFPTVPRYGTAIYGQPASRYAAARSYKYDELDRLVEMKFEDGRTVLYEHDAIGNVTKMTDPDGKVTRYEYFRDNLLHKMILERPSQPDRVFTYSYDAAGRLDEIEYPAPTQVKAIFRDNANTAGSGFDENGNLLFLRYEKNGTLIRRFEWTYDDSGNRQSQLDVTPTLAIKQEFSYDWLDRLVSVKRAQAANVASLPASPLGASYRQRELEVG